MSNQLENEVLTTLASRRTAASRGQWTTLVKAAAAQLGLSVPTLYRRLAQLGVSEPRKRRSDAGETHLTREQLSLIAGMAAASLNNKNQRMPLRVVVEILHAQGKLPPVSVSTVSRQLRAARMHPDHLALPAPSVQLRSLHPNHVGQFDSTVGAYYYLPGGRLRWMPEQEFNRNKAHNLVKAATDLLTRQTYVCHTTGAIKARHCLGGESAANALEFLVYAFDKQPASPVHGVPRILMMDPGGANKSGPMRNFLARLGIEPLWHAAGSARVTGSVEKAHDIIRMNFETRLRFVDPRQVTLEWLNDQLERWVSMYCSARVHGRHGMPRYEAWLKITADQLRAASSTEALRNAATHLPETRRVLNDSTVKFGGRLYDLAGIPGVVPGLKVTVALNIFRAPSIDVLCLCPETGAETWHVVEPAQLDLWGYRHDAPVIGETFRAARHTEVDQARSALTRQAYATGASLPTLEEAAKARRAHAQAYAGVVDVMADVKSAVMPTYIPKRGAAIDLPPRELAPQPLSLFKAARLLQLRLGKAYTPQVYADLEKRWPNGDVPTDQIEALAQQYLPPEADQAEAAAQGL